MSEKQIPDMNLEEAFADMMRKSFPNLPHDTKAYDAMHCSFMGGAWISFLRIKMAGAMPEAEGMKHLDSIERELDEFRRHTQSSVSIFAAIIKAGQEGGKRENDTKMGG